MTVEIKNISGDVIYTYAGDTLEGASLEGASLEGANLEGANLDGANLEGANLEGANLEGAWLKDVWLKGANLTGAKHIADIGNRSDGYQFFAQWCEGSVWILARCRYFPVEAATTHWEESRPGTPLGAESMEFIRRAKWVAKHHGWGK